MEHAPPGEGIGLRVDVSCLVGILPRERVEPQPLQIDLFLTLDLHRCGETGDLGASVDYGAVDAQIRFLAVEGRFRLLESLALAIARLVLLPPLPGEARAAVERVSVTIRKPTVLRAAEPRVVVCRGPEVLRGDVLVDVPEVRIRRVAAPAAPPVDAVHALASGSWLALERTPV